MDKVVAKLGIGLKLVIGLGILIGISVLVGTIAMLSMVSVQASSDELSQQFLPETVLAGDIERQTLKTMYNVRGYALTTDEKYLAEAEKSLVELERAVSSTQDLMAKSPKLVKLRETLPKAQAALATYKDLLNKTKASTREIAAARTSMDAGAKEFVSAIDHFIESESSKMTGEIQAGARSAALTSRLAKLSKGYAILNLGNNLRVANFKSQALRDASAITAALKDFEQIDTIGNELLKVLVQQADRDQISVMLRATDQYRKAVEDWLASTALLDSLSVQRNISGEMLGGVAEETSLAGVKTSQEMATTNSLVIAGANWTIVLGLFASIVLGILVAFVLIRSITGPLTLVTTLSKRVSSGDFGIERSAVKSQDELGVLTLAFYEMVDGLKAKAGIVESIAGGVLTNTIPLSSKDDGLGRSLQRMQESLNEILSQVNVAVDQMAGGSDQVSTAAQSLSQGATEQASSLEEISASANEIHSQSKQNAENALTANQLAKQASASAQQGNQQMKDLMRLLDLMTKSSEETKTIVKTIDDIAFQVNLLALNANVEAARAGKYGKGFAVVAEEVRNLAVRSATAVKETTRMVEESIRNIQEVNATAKKTGEQLNGILGNSNKVADFLEEIAASSGEQARAMGQINGGLEQIDQVTQSNTASAEESASASEELSSQAQQLKVMVSRFQLSGISLVKAKAPSAESTTASIRKSPPVLARKEMPLARRTSPPVKPAPGLPNDIILNDDFDTF